jgi:hypothetical protein
MNKIYLRVTQTNFINELKAQFYIINSNNMLMKKAQLILKLLKKILEIINN